MADDRLFIKCGSRYKQWGRIMEHREDVPLGTHVVICRAGSVSTVFNVKAASIENSVAKVELHQKIQTILLQTKNKSVHDVATELVDSLFS